MFIPLASDDSKILVFVGEEFKEELVFGELSDLELVVSVVVLDTSKVRSVYLTTTSLVVLSKICRVFVIIFLFLL